MTTTHNIQNIVTETQTLTYFSSASSLDSYQHFAPIARQVTLEGLEVCRADPQIVRSNIDLAILAITPHIDTIRRRLPEHPLAETLELPSLAIAFLYATSRVASPASVGEIDLRLERVTIPREAGLKQLEVFALLGMVPAERVEAIRRGRGVLDKARDAIAIPGMFREFRTTLAGQHPIPEAMLDQLADDGDWLVRAIQPGGARPAPTERDPASIERDQFWFILRQRYERLREAGVIVFGLRDLDQHIPPLNSRVAARRPSEERPAPSPSPATPTTSPAGSR